MASVIFATSSVCSHDMCICGVSLVVMCDFRHISRLWCIFGCGMYFRHISRFHSASITWTVLCVCGSGGGSVYTCSDMWWYMYMGFAVLVLSAVMGYHDRKMASVL